MAAPMMNEREEGVYRVLESLQIHYDRHEHPPVFTVEEATRHWAGIHAAHCKNLFLRNKKGTIHYLVILEHSKQADLKHLAARLGDDRLSFASPERLMVHLGLTAGSVSPFGLINDRGRLVQVAIDLDLRDVPRIAFHPNVNTATIVLGGTDFQRFLTWCGNPVRWIRFGEGG
jgi:Ala-tRNA(Pro) deacylase